MGKYYTKNLIRDPYNKNIFIQTIVLRLNVKEAVPFLEKNGITMTPRTWYELKKRLLSERFQRIREIADTEMIDEYLNSINTIKYCQKEMLKAAQEETDPTAKVNILTQVVNTQPFLTEYYYNIRKVLERNKTAQVSKLNQELTV